MLNATTINKLNEMRLTAMADALREQIQKPEYANLTFEERIGLIIDVEWARRKNNQLARLIKKATFKSTTASVEDIEYHADRKLDPSFILKLSTCNYIHEKLNVIIMGASGAGKTYLSCALGMAACRNMLTTKYIRLPELLTELAIARGDGSYKKVIAQL
jgi:DNA replication protein DnaC